MALKGFCFQVPIKKLIDMTWSRGVDLTLEDGVFNLQGKKFAIEAVISEIKAWLLLSFESQGFPAASTLVIWCWS